MVRWCRCESQLAEANDSRVFGAVPGQFIYGKAVFVYWPVERFGALPVFSSDLQ